MRSTVSTLATVAAGLFATTASAQGKVAIYWGQGAYQKELSVVCQDPSVDIVNIAFVNGFPQDRTTYPDTNFGNACGGDYFTNPNGTPSKLLSSCPTIAQGITVCRNNGKKVLLSLGGGYPTDYYIANDDAAKWLAEVLVGSFGPRTDRKWPRPFGNSFVDGFDLDIESSTAAGDRKWKYYAELVNYIKALSPSMLISAAPQCVVPDAHLDDAISKAPFDYIFTQFYNTDECSARLGFEQRTQSTTGFTFDKWTARLQEKSRNKNVKLFMGLPAGTNGAKASHYLTPVEANYMVTKYKNTALWGGVMLWEATVSQNNTQFGQGYSSWIKYSIEGTFAQNYKPAVSSTIRSSSTLVSSTRSSTSASSTKISTSASSTKTSSAVPSTSSAPVVSSSSSVPSSTKSSSVVLSSSSTAKSSSSVAPSSSSVVPSSSSVATSSSSTHVASSSSVYVDVSSSSVLPSSVEYTDYFSTAIPTHYSSSSATAEPSTVYPEDVSSTAVHSSSSVFVTSSASSTYEVSSSADVTSSVSSTYEVSSSADVTSSASSIHETSSTPAVTSSASDYSSVVPSSTSSPSASEPSDYSSYSVSSSTVDYDVSSSSTPIGASSTPCTTSTELYPESSKTPDASSSTSEYQSESSKVPEISSTASEYPSESSKVPEASSSSSVEYGTESSKTPEVSTSYSASSSTSSDASSTPCTTSTEVYPTSSKTPEASSATDYSYYSESSKVPEVSSTSKVEYPTGSETVSTKTPEASSSASEHGYYPESSPVPDVSSKTPVPTEYEIYSSATPTTSKPAESTTTVVTTTYLDTCSTGLTTKTATITKTVCNACAKPSDKPEGDYPSDWTTSVYVDKTLTVTITKPIHPATDVPAYPTIVSEPAAPRPSAPAADYPVDKEEVPSYETPAKSSSVPYEATKPSPKPEAPSHPEVPSSEKPSAPAAEYPVASSKANYPEDATVTLSQYITLTKVATPVAYTPVAYATPIVHQGYPVGNGTVPSSTGGVKPSATGTGKPIKPSPSGYAPPEFEGAASKLSMGMTGVVAIVAFFML